MSFPGLNNQMTNRILKTIEIMVIESLFF